MIELIAQSETTARNDLESFLLQLAASADEIAIELLLSVT
jgi:hypothetical protein